MNLKNFQSKISSLILQHGKEYADNGAVTMLEKEGKGMWQAHVEGSGIYSVEVWLEKNDDIEHYSCDCPHDADVCKHIVAVLYELKARTKTIKLEPSKKKSQALSFGDLLKKVSASELTDFVERFAANDKNFKTQFEIHFAHKDEKIDLEKKYGDLIKKAIKSSMSQGFLDYHATQALALRIDTFLDKAEACVGNENFKEAATIVRVVLKQLIEEVIPNADDSDGDVEGTIFRARSVLASVVHSTHCPRGVKENIHDFLAKALFNRDYFEYGDNGYDLFVLFRTLSAQLGSSEALLEFTERFPKKPVEPGVSNYREEFFIMQTVLFYQETGNTAEAEKLIQENIDIVEIRRGLVEQEIERKDYSEAKQLIDEGIVVAERIQQPGTVSAWEKVLLRIAELEDDVALVRHFNKRFTFDRGFSPEYYQNWKSTFSEAEWEIEFERLVLKIGEEVEQEAENHLNNRWWSKSYTLLNRLAPIYIQEKHWHKLYELVEAYPSLEVLLNYMKYLAKDYQPELIDLLVPALLLAGDRADSRSGYAKLASHMKDIMKLIPVSRAKILETAQALRTKYPRRPAMRDELKVIR